MKLNNLILVGLMIGFFLLGYNTYQDAKPQPKSERIYKELKQYMPYVIEQRVGGFNIVSKITGEKEKPPSTEVYKRLDQLEKMWGKEFLSIEGNYIIVKDKSNNVVGKVKIELPTEKLWVESFFELNQ